MSYVRFCPFGINWIAHITHKSYRTLMKRNPSTSREKRTHKCESNNNLSNKGCNKTVLLQTLFERTQKPFIADSARKLWQKSIFYQINKVACFNMYSYRLANSMNSFVGFSLCKIVCASHGLKAQSNRNEAIYLSMSLASIDAKRLFNAKWLRQQQKNVSLTWICFSIICKFCRWLYSMFQRKFSGCFYLLYNMAKRKKSGKNIRFESIVSMRRLDKFSQPVFFSL